MAGRVAYMGFALLVAGCGSNPLTIPEQKFEADVIEDEWHILNTDDMMDLQSRLPSQGDIEIDGPLDDQVAIRRMLHELRKSFKDQQAPPGPFGSTSERYNHHIFWDSDIWIFPAICFLDPAAKIIPDFRVRTMQPTGAPFFWETKPDGTDGTPSSSALHRSAPGSVAWMMRRAAQLGLAQPEDAEKVNFRVRDYYRSISLKGVRSIDEYAEKVDDELYTNLVANAAEGNAPPRYPLARDEISLINWKGDDARTYQQAAGALLAVWPLEHPAANPKVIADRFAPKINRAGPAMSEPIISIAYSRADEPQKAYEHWRKGWRDFSGIRFLRFSEYRSDTDEPNAGYFLTGAAGEINAILYGFLGIRVQPQKDPKARWSTPLKMGAWLNMTPVLPKEWKRVMLRGFRVLDQTLTLTVEGDSVRVAQDGPEVN